MPSLVHPVSLAFLCAGCASGPEAAAPDPQLQQAYSLLDAGEAYDALSALETWLAAHADAPAEQRAEAHGRAAHACAVLRQPEEGLLHAEAGIALSPGDPWLHYARGVALHTMGEYTAALEAFSRALELEPGHVKSAQWRGYTKLLLDRPAEAVQDYDAALAILQASDEAVFLTWGASRRDLMIVTLRGRADAFDALGDHSAAETDRVAARNAVQAAGD